MIRRFLLREGPLKLGHLAFFVAFIGVLFAVLVTFFGMPIEAAIIIGPLPIIALVLFQIEEIQKEVDRRKNTQHC